MIRALCALDSKVKKHIQPYWLTVLDGLATIKRTGPALEHRNGALDAWRGFGVDIGLDSNEIRDEELRLTARVWAIPLVGCCRIQCPLHLSVGGVRGLLRCSRCLSVSTDTRICGSQLTFILQTQYCSMQCQLM